MKSLYSILYFFLMIVINSSCTNEDCICLPEFIEIKYNDSRDSSIVVLIDKDNSFVERIKVNGTIVIFSTNSFKFKINTIKDYKMYIYYKLQVDTISRISFNSNFVKKKCNKFLGFIGGTNFECEAKSEYGFFFNSIYYKSQSISR